MLSKSPIKSSVSLRISSTSATIWSSSTSSDFSLADSLLLPSGAGFAGFEVFLLSSLVFSAASAKLTLTTAFVRSKIIHSFDGNRPPVSSALLFSCSSSSSSSQSSAIFFTISGFAFSFSPSNSTSAFPDSWLGLVVRARVKNRASPKILTRGRLLGVVSRCSSAKTICYTRCTGTSGKWSVSEISLLWSRELTSAQVWYLRAVAVGKTFSHFSQANVCKFVFSIFLLISKFIHDLYFCTIV